MSDFNNTHSKGETEEEDIHFHDENNKTQEEGAFSFRENAGSVTVDGCGGSQQ